MVLEAPRRLQFLEPYRPLLTAALSFAVLTYAVSQMLLVPSLPTIQRQLHLTPVAGTSLLTAFFVSGAVTAGIVGRLGDMFGKRKLLLATLSLFTLGALVAAASNSFQLLLLGRIVMGCAVGAFPLAFSIVRDELPTPLVPTAIGVMGSFGAGGAVIGQVCGGLVTDAFGFHWIFWISVLSGCLAVAGVAAFVPESASKTPGRIDLGGALLLAGGLGAPLVALGETPRWGWAGRNTLLLVAAGVVLLAAFARHERSHPAPVLHLPTLLLPRVRAANLATLLVGFGLFGTSAIVSQFVQTPSSTGWGLGANATAAGIFFVPGLGLMLLGSPVNGRIIARYGAKLGLVLGAGLGCLGLALLRFSHSSDLELFLWPSVVYVGISFAFASAPLLILEAVPPELRGQSTAVNLIMRNVGTSLGIQLAAAIVTASVRHGVPSEGGYLWAFTLEAAAAFGAVLLGLAIPRLPRVLVPVPPEPVGEGA